jgi:SAP domain-containing ribonucleoprotein
MADYATLKVPDLKKLLQERQLPASGNKADLIARLQEHDKASEEPKPSSAPGSSSSRLFISFGYL